MSQTRLTTELSLLHAIYPDQITYAPQSGNLKYTQSTATLTLHIPPTYPTSGQPDVQRATDLTKNDIKTQTSAAVAALSLPDGEECLDAIISAFSDVVSCAESAQPVETAEPPGGGDEGKKTVIIWLHHLLATSKRKLCISPPLAGVSKPGYPGVLVYSGPSAGVDAHVAELKAQNWAAFQVRLEEDVEWVFVHERVKEVESMGDLVGAVGVEGERGRRQKEELLKAVGIK